MALDLASASPEVRQFHEECVDECEARIRQELQSHPVMQASGMGGFGASINIGNVSDIVKFTLDSAVAFFGAPLEQLVITAKPQLQKWVSDKVLIYVKQLANDAMEHPVMGALRQQFAGQGPPQAGHAATGA